MINHDIVEDVESVHSDGHITGEHDGCGVRIVVHVELRQRRDVARSCRSTHDDDAFQVAGCLGMSLQQLRDVGEGSQGY